MHKLKIEDVNLDQYFFPSIELAANPAYKFNEETMTVFSARSNVEEVGNGNRFAVSTQVKSNAEESSNYPYSFELNGIAFFTVNEENFDHDNAMEACYYLGHQLLFGAIREQIAVLTGRGPWESVQLRSIKPEPYSATKAGRSSEPNDEQND